VQENKGVARKYRGRGLLVGVDAGEGTEEWCEKVYK
jgi:hypothetical protein